MNQDAIKDEYKGIITGILLLTIAPSIGNVMIPFLENLYGFEVLYDGLFAIISGSLFLLGLFLLFFNLKGALDEKKSAELTVLGVEFTLFSIFFSLLMVPWLIILSIPILRHL